MTADEIRERISGPGSVVAVDNNEGIGIVLTEEVSDNLPGPLGPTVKVANEHGIENYYLYGPAVVDKNHRRQGVLRTMNEASIEMARQKGGYISMVGFIEMSNEASKAAHSKGGWKPVDTFEFDGREYVAIVHSL